MRGSVSSYYVSIVSFKRLALFKKMVKELIRVDSIDHIVEVRNAILLIT